MDGEVELHRTYLSVISDWQILTLSTELVIIFRDVSLVEHGIVYGALAEYEYDFHAENTCRLLTIRFINLVCHLSGH